MFWGVGGRKGVRQRKVSDVSGPKCGGCSTEGLRAWEQERGKNRNATPETAFAPPTNNRMFKLFKMLQLVTAKSLMVMKVMLVIEKKTMIDG